MTAGPSSWLVKWPGVPRRLAGRPWVSCVRASWELTKADISAGFCGKPMTLAQLRAKYGSGPRMACRPIQRHGIVQGQKQQRGPDGSLMFHPNGAPVNVDKIRLVDDSHRSLHNSHLIRTCETVAPCPFTYMAGICVRRCGPSSPGYERPCPTGGLLHGRHALGISAGPTQ